MVFKDVLLLVRLFSCRMTSLGVTGAIFAEYQYVYIEQEKHCNHNCLVPVLSFKVKMKKFIFSKAPACSEYGIGLILRLGYLDKVATGLYKYHSTLC